MRLWVLSLTVSLSTIMQLYVSPNLGENWTFLGNNVSRFGWRVMDEEYESSTALYYERDFNGESGFLLRHF